MQIQVLRNLIKFYPTLDNDYWPCNQIMRSHAFKATLKVTMAAKC